ncbi:MAG: hypothetical protein ACO2PN_27410 [Pyrobaculum sp.]|jgi:hypothetical protein
MKHKTSWVKYVPITIATIGAKRVRKKKSGKIYEYVYIRLRIDIWTEIVNAYKVRIRVAPPDLSAPPIVMPARRFLSSSRSVAFDVPREYQKLIREYARNGTVAVLDVDVIEKIQEENATVG